MHLPTVVSSRLSSLQEARAARVERRRLVAELESYSTPAERAELAAIFDRHSAEQLEQLRVATGRRFAA